MISATNADLRAQVQAGRFREDLYYRLNVIELEIPPLADRPDDILPLAYHFLNDDMTIEPEAEIALQLHEWPGNVRELQNTVQRAALLAADHTIRAQNLTLQPASPVEARQRFAPIEPDEAEIRNALAGARGVVARAARRLGMSRQALYRRMEKFGIQK